MEEKQLNLTNERKEHENLDDMGIIKTKSIHTGVSHMIASIKSDSLPDVSEFETQPLGSEIW